MRDGRYESFRVRTGSRSNDVLLALVEHWQFKNIARKTIRSISGKGLGVLNHGSRGWRGVGGGGNGFQKELEFDEKLGSYLVPRALFNFK